MTPIPLKMTPIPLYSRATTRTEPQKNRARATRSQAEKRFEFKGLLVRSSILEFELKVEFKGSCEFVNSNSPSRVRLTHSRRTDQ